MTTTTTPIHPRVVTPPMRVNRWVAVAMAVWVVAGLSLVALGATARTHPPRATAVVVERAGSRQLVSVIDGPRPDRFLVDWADDIPIGQPFTVGLGALCGCVPQPAVLASRRDPQPLVIVMGLLALACPVSGLVSGGRMVAAGRRAQRRAEAVVGTGPGPIVHLLPIFTASPLPLHGELWPVDGGPSLGRLALARVDHGFDPSVPFAAWGGPPAGGAVALTSVDGRQVVLPTSGLLEGTAGPALDPRVTAAAIALLGWPSTAGPGDPGRTARVDAAMAVIRARERTTRAVSALLGLAVGAVLAAATFRGWSAPLAALLVLLIAAVAVLHHSVQAPLRALIDPAVESDRKLGRKVFKALVQARWDQGEGTSPQGPGAGADGPGWTPSTPAPR